VVLVGAAVAAAAAAAEVVLAAAAALCIFRLSTTCIARGRWLCW
jgi:hypothetical protein